MAKKPKQNVATPQAPVEATQEVPTTVTLAVSDFEFLKKQIADLQAEVAEAKAVRVDATQKTKVSEEVKTFEAVHAKEEDVINGDGEVKSAAFNGGPKDNSNGFRETTPSVVEDINVTGRAVMPDGKMVEGQVVAIEVNRY